MNAKEKEQIHEINNKINILDRKVQGILDVLLDDKRTSRIGVISEVEAIRKDLHTITSAYKLVKWVVISVITIIIGVLGNYTIR